MQNPTTKQPRAWLYNDLLAICAAALITGPAVTAQAAAVTLLRPGGPATFKNLSSTVPPKNGYTVLYRFSGSDDGAGAYNAPLVDTAGNTYGTTLAGGTFGQGTVYKRSLDGTLTVLHTFTGGDDGGQPWCFPHLVMDEKGNLYGTTYAGGAYGYGVVFKLSPSGKEHVLHSFTNGIDGASPWSSVILDQAGNLYGTTYNGGTYGAGVVYKLASDGTSAWTWSLGASGDGQYSADGLFIDKGGNVYGTSPSGGAYGLGAVFKVTPDGQETVLYSFGAGEDANTPYGFLISDKEGDLYGTSLYGGVSGLGAVFKLEPSGKETVLYSFQGGSDGEFPIGGVHMDSKGSIYGVTTEGGDTDCGPDGEGCGTVFMLSPDGSKHTVMYAFHGGRDGANPQEVPSVGNHGALFGTTWYGGNRKCNGKGCGTIFRLKTKAS